MVWSDSFPKGICVGTMKAGRHTSQKGERRYLSERVPVIKKKNSMEAKRPANSPAVNPYLLLCFCCPKQCQALRFQDHPNPQSSTSALVYSSLSPKILAVLLEKSFHCFSLSCHLLRMKTSFWSSFSWVRSLPPRPLPEFFHPSNRMPEALASLLQPCRLCAYHPPHPWGFSAAPAEGLSSIVSLLSLASPHPRTHSPELFPEEPPHFEAGKDVWYHSHAFSFFFFFFNRWGI